MSKRAAALRALGRIGAGFGPTRRGSADGTVRCTLSVGGPELGLSGVPGAIDRDALRLVDCCRVAVIYVGVVLQVEADRSPLGAVEPHKSRTPSRFQAVRVDAPETRRGTLEKLPNSARLAPVTSGGDTPDLFERSALGSGDGNGNRDAGFGPRPGAPVRVAAHRGVAAPPRAGNAIKWGKLPHFLRPPGRPGRRRRTRRADPRSGGARPRGGHWVWYRHE